MSLVEYRDHLRSALHEHQASVTAELLNCSCGWHVKRGEGSTARFVEHVSEVALTSCEQDQRGWSSWPNAPHAPWCRCKRCLVIERGKP